MPGLSLLMALGFDVVREVTGSITASPGGLGFGGWEDVLE